MASLPDILRSYSQLQCHRYSVDISKCTTSSGITTFELRKFMSSGDIVDEDLLVSYVRYCSAENKKGSIMKGIVA